MSLESTLSAMPLAPMLELALVLELELVLVPVPVLMLMLMLARAEKTWADDWTTSTGH